MPGNRLARHDRFAQQRATNMRLPAEDLNRTAGLLLERINWARKAWRGTEREWQELEPVKNQALELLRLVRTPPSLIAVFKALLGKRTTSVWDNPAFEMAARVESEQPPRSAEGMDEPYRIGHVLSALPLKTIADQVARRLHNNVDYRKQIRRWRDLIAYRGLVEALRSSRGGQ